MHRLAWDDARGLHFHTLALGALDRALAVNRVAKAIDNTAQQALANRHVNDGAQALDGVAFLDLAVGTENHDTDIVGFQVQGHALDPVRELDHLAGLDLVQPVDTGDTVTDGEDLTDLGDISFGTEVRDLAFQNV